MKRRLSKDERIIFEKAYNLALGSFQGNEGRRAWQGFVGVFFSTYGNILKLAMDKAYADLAAMEEC